MRDNSTNTVLRERPVRQALPLIESFKDRYDNLRAEALEHQPGFVRIHVGPDAFDVLPDDADAFSIVLELAAIKAREQGEHHHG